MILLLLGFLCGIAVVMVHVQYCCYYGIFGIFVTCDITVVMVSV